MCLTLGLIVTQLKEAFAKLLVLSDGELGRWAAARGMSQAAKSSCVHPAGCLLWHQLHACRQSEHWECLSDVTHTHTPVCTAYGLAYRELSERVFWSINCINLWTWAFLLFSQSVWWSLCLFSFFVCFIDTKTHNVYFESDDKFYTQHLCQKPFGFAIFELRTSMHIWWHRHGHYLLTAAIKKRIKSLNKSY